MREFDITAGDWLPEDDAKDNLPDPRRCFAYAAPVRNEFYVLAIGDLVYRYNLTGSPGDAWTLVGQDLIIFHRDGGNFGFDLMYHYLLP